MTAAGRQDATGGAAALQLFNPVTDPAALSFQVTGTTSGWTFSQNFTIAIDPDTPSEEKVLCSTISGASPSTIAVVTRGYDNTVPTTHGVGARVTHILPATIIDDVERHIYVTGEDDHTQYLNATRHDTPNRHGYGSPGTSFALGAGTTVPADVGTAASAGNGTSPARDNHVHKLAVASINAFNLFTAGLIGTTPDTTDVGATTAAGTASKFARADHVHAPPAGYHFVYVGPTAPSAPFDGLEWSDTTKDRQHVWSGTAWVPVSGALPFIWKRSGSVQGFANSGSAWTVVSGWGVIEDADGMDAGASSGFTVPATLPNARWRITAYVHWSSPSPNDTGHRGLRLEVTGGTASNHRISMIRAEPGADTGGTKVLRLDPGQTVLCSVFCNGASTGDALGGTNDNTHYFQAEYLGP